MAMVKFGAKPIRIDPIPARIKKEETVLRGPQESAMSPVGSCMAAYA
jgi:hypothetical protein